MREPAGNETKTATVTTGAVSSLSDFSFTTPNSASYAMISCTGNNVRVTFSGTDPTSTLGHMIKKDDTNFELANGRNVQNIKLIALDGDATVTITIGR